MKAVLIIDMPEDFDYRRCRIGGDGNIYYERNGEHRPQRASIIGNIKNLKPMPQKKEVEVNEIEDIMHTEYSIEDIYKNKYVADIQLATDKLISLGWNACISEILGEEDE